MRNTLPPALPPDAAAWLQAHGAVSVRVCEGGIIEFSRRPMPDALTAAVRDLLPASQNLPVSVPDLAHSLLQE